MSNVGAIIVCMGIAVVGWLVGSDLSDINDKDKRYDMGTDKESV